MPKLTVGPLSFVYDEDETGIPELRAGIDQFGVPYIDIWWRKGQDRRKGTLVIVQHFKLMQYKRRGGNLRICTRDGQNITPRRAEYTAAGWTSRIQLPD
jgi:hypothetical protein